MVSCGDEVRRAERGWRKIYLCGGSLGAGNVERSDQGVGCADASSCLGALPVLMLTNPTPGKDYYINV